MVRSGRSLKGGVDDTGVRLPQHVVAEAEALHGPWDEVLGDDVGLLQEPHEYLLPLGGLEVDGDVLLVEVEGVECGAGALEEGSGAEAADGAPRWFDLDDLGAELCEHHGAVGAEPDVGEVEDPDVLEDLGHLNPVLDGGFGNELCGLVCLSSFKL